MDLVAFGASPPSRQNPIKQTLPAREDDEPVRGNHDGRGCAEAMHRRTRRIDAAAVAGYAARAMGLPISPRPIKPMRSVMWYSLLMLHYAHGLRNEKESRQMRNIFQSRELLRRA